MAAFVLIGSYGNGTSVDGPELSNEFTNIYEALNGTSTDKELHHKFSGSEPALVVEQNGAGKILSLRANGVEVYAVDNTGKIISAASRITLQFDFFTPDPTNFIDGPEFFKRFVVPPNAIRIINLKIIRSAGGGHAVGTSIAFQIVKNGVLVGSTISFSNSNNLQDTVYNTVQNIAVVAGDIINWNHADTGSIAERNVTIIIEYETSLN